jgi:large exoprotein involved in heme utilization and adhesion
LSKLGSTEAQAGDIKFNSSEALTIANNSTIENSIFLEAFGNAGNIDIQTKTLSIRNGAQINSSTFGNGDAGNIIVNANVAVNLDGTSADGQFASAIFSTLNTGTTGKAGNIDITADSLSLTNGADINSSTYGNGDGGNITVNAADNISLDALGIIRSNVEEGAVGNGGQIKVDTGTLNLTKGGQILTIVREARSNLPAGEGNAGNIIVNARGAVNLDGTSADGQFASAIFSTLNTGATGKAGNIDITADSLSLTNGVQINSSTYGNGDGGSLTINTGSLTVDSGANISTDTLGEGNAGNLTVNVDNFTVQNSQVSASTLGKGNAGNLTVNASESVELSGELPEIDGNRGFPGGLFAQIDIAEGKGGNLTINTQRLSVSDGSKIQVATFGKGDAGELTIRASQIDVIDTEAKDNIFFTGIFAGIQQDRFGSTELAEGNAGKLTIETDRLSIIGSGRVEANNSGIGNAGDISITAKDLVEVVGVNNGTPSFIGAEVAPPDGNNPITPELISGNGGNVTIDTRQLIVKDGGRISASTYGKGDSGDLTINASDSILLSGEGSGLFAQADPKATGKGGVLNIQTGNLDLSDRAEISASTASNEGGNINLKIDDTLTMRNNSLISAQALKNADGGNINIDTNFIVAFPNQINGNGSDIIANAAEGDGGRISINAESLLGIEERKALNNNQTNDIDASSDFGLNGTVSIFTPDINPVQGVIELPSNVVEPEQTTEQACQANREAAAKNALVINGKGGIPAPPDQPLTSQNLIVNGEITSAYAIPEPIETSKGKIQLARGIKVTKDGGIILTPYATNNAGERIPEGRINCGQI